MTARAFLVAMVVALAALGTMIGLMFAFGPEAKVDLGGADAERQLIALGASMAVGFVAGLGVGYMARKNMASLNDVLRDSMRRHGHARA